METVNVPRNALLLAYVRIHSRMLDDHCHFMRSPTLFTAERRRSWLDTVAAVATIETALAWTPEQPFDV